jgi:hypothetical protein
MYRTNRFRFLFRKSVFDRFRPFSSLARIEACVVLTTEFMILSHKEFEPQNGLSVILVIVPINVCNKSAS